MASRTKAPSAYPVRPSSELCSWVDCPHKWVTIGVGHNPAIMPVDEYGETAMCAHHLAAWQLSERAAIEAQGTRTPRSLAEYPNGHR